MAGAECCIPAPPAEVIATGKEEKWGHLPVYVSAPPSQTTSAVVLVSDVFGWEAPLLRKLADKVAAAGFLVVVPDFLAGEPYDPAKGEPIQEWIKRHLAHEKAFEDCKGIVETLKAKGYNAIACSGCCWGAKVSILVAKEGSINSVALLHPSFVTVEDIKDVTSKSKVSVAILGAEHDHLSPPSLIEEMKAILDAHEEVQSFVKIYKGVAHGWTVRYDVNNELAAQKAIESHMDLVEWLKTSLKI